MPLSSVHRATYDGMSIAALFSHLSSIRVPQRASRNINTKEEESIVTGRKPQGSMHKERPMLRRE